MMMRYEVAIHNAEVRRLVYAGEHHSDLSDGWSQTHYLDILARSVTDAESKIYTRYPRDRGFVIEAVKEA